MLSRQRTFDQILARAGTGGAETTSPQEKAREAARQLVAISLVQPVLKQMRASTSAEPPFGPSKAEQSMRALADAELAQRVVSAEHWPLIDRLAERLAQKVRSNAKDTLA